VSATPWTPGPWRYSGHTDNGDESGWLVQVAERRAICVEGRSAAEADANARLIAGAPEMAEALEALIQLVTRPTSTVDQLAEDQDAEHPEVVAARTLLSRIRGDAT